MGTLRIWRLRSLPALPRLAAAALVVALAAGAGHGKARAGGLERRLGDEARALQLDLAGHGGRAVSRPAGASIELHERVTLAGAVPTPWRETMPLSTEPTLRGLAFKSPEHQGMEAALRLPLSADSALSLRPRRGGMLVAYKATF